MNPESPSLDRRHFLLASAAGAATALLGGPTPIRARRLERVGLQLYTVRAELAGDVEGTLSRVAGIGFDEVELAGLAGRSAPEFAALLERNGLSAPSSHVQLADLDGDALARQLEVCATLGHRYLVCAWLAPEQRGSLDLYRAHADLFNRAGERCRAAGVRLAYHNHDFELQAMTSGGSQVVPYDLLLERCDPELVAFEMDLYWITKGGADPLAYFEKWPGRFELFHVKDMDDTAQKAFTEVGTGVIDFERIFARSEQAGTRHFFVEQDVVKGDVWESLRTSYTTTRKLREG